VFPPAHPWISEVEPRLYAITMPPYPADSDLESFAEAREIWGRACDHVHSWLVDTSAIEETSARQRRRLAQHLEAYEWVDVRWNAGSALVIPSPIVRGFVTAVFWLKSPKFPNATFAERGPALSWCRAKLAAHPRVP
jgi:hypothetical protein